MKNEASIIISGLNADQAQDLAQRIAKAAWRGNDGEEIAVTAKQIKVVKKSRS